MRTMDLKCWRKRDFSFHVRVNYTCQLFRSMNHLHFGIPLVKNSFRSLKKNPGHSRDILVIFMWNVEIDRTSDRRAARIFAKQSSVAKWLSSARLSNTKIESLCLICWTKIKRFFPGLVHGMSTILGTTANRTSVWFIAITCYFQGLFYSGLCCSRPTHRTSKSVCELVHKSSFWYPTESEGHMWTFLIGGFLTRLAIGLILTCAWPLGAVFVNLPTGFPASSNRCTLNAANCAI